MLSLSSTKFLPFFAFGGFDTPAGTMPFNAGTLSSFSVYRMCGGFFFFPSPDLGLCWTGAGFGPLGFFDLDGGPDFDTPPPDFELDFDEGFLFEAFAAPDFPGGPIALVFPCLLERCLRAGRKKCNFYELPAESTSSAKFQFRLPDACSRVSRRDCLQIQRTT